MAKVTDSWQYVGCEMKVGESRYLKRQAVVVVKNE